MSEHALQFTVDYPPSMNHLYSTVRGRRVLSAEGRAYHQTAHYQAKQQGAAPLRGPLAVRLDYHPPLHVNRMVADGDNLCKALFDALKGAAWIDDRQVSLCTWERHECVPKTEASVRVTVWLRPTKSVAIE